MVDLRADFKEWLLKQALSEEKAKYTQKTVNDYVRRVNQIYKNNFQYSSRQRDELSEDILPILAKYYEYTNKEYYLDRVTIWYSLEYFHKILEFIYPARDIIRDDEKTVKLYLFHNKENYLLATINLKYLYDYTQLFNSFVYGGSDLSTNIKYDERQVFLSSLREIINKNKVEAPRNVAFHIVYEQKSIRQEKAALTQYCSFLYSKFSSVQYDYKNNDTIQLIINENPTNLVGGNYDEDPITGEHAMQIRIKDKNKVYYYNYECEDDLDCVLIIRDLVKIFDIDADTLKKDLLKRYHFETLSTEIRTYHSINSTNACLKKFYHPLTKKHPEVNYKQAGYKDYWCNKKKAVDILEISKNAFHTHIDFTNCTYINYSDYMPKYYVPDLEYLKNTIDIQKAKFRKRKYSIKSNSKLEN